MQAACTTLSSIWSIIFQMRPPKRGDFCNSEKTSGCCRRKLSIFIDLLSSDWEYVRCLSGGLRVCAVSIGYTIDYKQYDQTRVNSAIWKFLRHIQCYLYTYYRCSFSSKNEPTMKHCYSNNLRSRNSGQITMTTSCFFIKRCACRVRQAISLCSFIVK